MVTKQRIKNILIVCAANYCRSPVAEKLLQDRFKNDCKFESAGTIGFNIPNMDPRSYTYLMNNLGNFSSHLPRRINNIIFKKHDLIYAIDHKILMELNNLFPKQKNKIKLFALENEIINITDPYKMNDKDYHEIMEKIKYISSKIDFNI